MQSKFSMWLENLSKFIRISRNFKETWNFYEHLKIFHTKSKNFRFFEMKIFSFSRSTLSRKNKKKKKSFSRFPVVRENFSVWDLRWSDAVWRHMLPVGVFLAECWFALWLRKVYGSFFDFSRCCTFQFPHRKSFLVVVSAQSC